MIRPPTPDECIPVLWWSDWSDKERDAMQEALTCEWLIEHGFMPDPSDLDPDINPDTYDESWIMCEYEDKTL